MDDFNKYLRSCGNSEEKAAIRLGSPQLGFQKLTLDLAISVKVLRNESEDKTMRIQEAASRLGISARRLRHYENEGLISPHRDASGYRRYTPGDLATAEWVRDLIGAGFSTRELRGLVPAFDQGTPKPAPNCAAIMRDKLGQIDRLVAALTARRNALSKRLAAQQGADGEGQGGLDNENLEHTGSSLPAAGRLR